MSFVVHTGAQVELVCRCGRHLASVGMNPSGPVNGDRYGLITVRGRSRARGQTGDVVDDGHRLWITCGNPRCRLKRVVRDETVIQRAERAHRAGRRQIVLGDDL